MVEDTSDNPVAGASVQRSGDDLVGRTNAEGRLTFQCELPCRVRVEAEGFVGGSFTLTSSATVHLERASASEQVSVSAYRALLEELESPVTTRLLAENALHTAATVTLDHAARPGRIEL